MARLISCWAEPHEVNVSFRRREDEEMKSSENFPPADFLVAVIGGPQGISTSFRYVYRLAA